MSDHVQERRKSRSWIAWAVLGALGIGVLVGALLQVDPWGVRAPYDVDQDGLTFGSAADADSPENEPDLILVVADDGTEGYVYNADLDEASGVYAQAGFDSPEDALV